MTDWGLGLSLTGKLGGEGGEFPQEAGFGPRPDSVLHVAWDKALPLLGPGLPRQGPQLGDH